MAVNTSAFETALQTKMDATSDAKEMLLLGKAYESTAANIVLSDINAAGVVATNKANEASTSATSATGSASTATTKAAAALASEGIATTKAGEASASATAASGSASSASGSATTATTKAGEASASATAAATSESNAASAATTAVNAVIDTAPANLNTLNELAEALGDDANYASTTTTALGNRYTKAETDSKIVALSPPATKAHVESLGIAASSITGALPAISGASLTGIETVITQVDEPTGQSVGAFWFNTDKKVLYIHDGTVFVAVYQEPLPPSTLAIWESSIPVISGIDSAIKSSGSSTVGFVGAKDGCVGDDPWACGASANLSYMALFKITPSSSGSQRLYIRSQMAAGTGGSNVGIHEGDLQMFGYELNNTYYGTHESGVFHGFEANSPSATGFVPHVAGGANNGTTGTTPNPYWHTPIVYATAADPVRGTWSSKPDNASTGSGSTGRLDNPINGSGGTMWYHETSGHGWSIYNHGRTQVFEARVGVPVYMLIGLDAPAVISVEVYLGAA
jgi:hypothetical protein